MVLTHVRLSTIRGEYGGIHCELPGDIYDHLERGSGEVVWDKSHAAQGTELERICQVIVRGPEARNTVEIPFRQREEAHETFVGSHRRKAIAASTLGLGEELDWHEPLPAWGEENLRHIPRFSMIKRILLTPQMV
jgi:hypothetical protein